MNGIIKRIKQVFSKSNNVDKLSFGKITKKDLPFFIGWIAIILWLDCYALPVGSVNEIDNLSKTSPADIFSYIYPIATASFIFLFDVRKLMSYLKLSGIVSLFGILSEAILGASLISYIGIILAAVGLGHIVASTGYGFFMILNNSEKLYSISIGIFISKVILLIKVYFINSGGGILLFRTMKIIGIIPLIICIWFYHKIVSQDTFEPGKKVPLKNYGVLILAFVVFLFNDFLAPALWHNMTTVSQSTLNIYNAIGVFIGIIFVLVIQQLFRCNICYVLNSSFAILTLGFVISKSVVSDAGLLISTLLFGISYTFAFISIYYILGILLKKYRDMAFYKIGIAAVAVFYISGFSITQALEKQNSEDFLSFIVLLSITILLAVFLMTPLFTKIIYSAEWTDDLKRSDVSYTDRLAAHISEFKLSARETEVCILLLDGYTMRQISALLSISYSTVNTYCTSIYRKLKINSRTELIIKFSDYISK